MKRLGLTLVAAVCLTATTFAAGNQPTTAKWEGNINITKLSKYLNLDSNQHEEVANICEYFTEQMERATNSKKNQEKLLRNACLLYTSPSPRDRQKSRMPSSA